MRIGFVAALLLMTTTPLLAQDVPLPRQRPPGLSTQEKAPDTPSTAADTEEAGEPGASADADGAPLEEGAASKHAPKRVYQVQCPAVIEGLVEAELLPPLTEGNCGEHTPWSVTGVRVGGRMVPLSAPATLNCEMAQTLPAWAEMVDGFLQARANTELSELAVGTSYSCRDSVGSDTVRMSEHGFSNALDVTGFVLGNGRDVTVEGDWSPQDTGEGRFLRFAHDAACSRFATTLGPEANAEHHDHFHIDMGCHGDACQARLCE